MGQSQQEGGASKGADIVANDDSRRSRAAWPPVQAPDSRDRWQVEDIGLVSAFVILVVAPVMLMAIAVLRTDHEGLPAKVWWAAIALFALLPLFDLWSRISSQHRGIRGVGVVESVESSSFVQGVASPYWAVASCVTVDGQTHRHRIPLLRPVPVGASIPLVYSDRGTFRPTCVASRRDQIRLTLRSCGTGIVSQCYLLCGLGATALLLIPAE